MRQIEMRQRGAMLWMGGLVLAVLLGGCTDTQIGTIGNGKVDVIEAGLIRAAVEGALTARPDAAAPAYAAATAILAALPEGESEETALAVSLDDALAAKLAELHMEPATEAVVLDLAAWVRALLLAQLRAADLVPEDKRVVIRDVVSIVRDVAAAHMGGVQ